MILGPTCDRCNMKSRCLHYRSGRETCYYEYNKKFKRESENYLNYKKDEKNN